MKIENGVLSKINDIDIVNGKFIIPGSVNKIDNYAFSDCHNLKSIIIPNSIIEIREGVFSYCINLKSITIPYSVNKIGHFSFYNCRSLYSKKGDYKAFEKGLTCKNMQYIPNEWNRVEGDIKVCEWGLHYVTNLFDIFNYYSGDLEKDIEIWEVEVGDIIVNNDDSKKATNAIKPIKRISKQEILYILNNK